MAVSPLDAREEHFRIPSDHHGRSLFLRPLPPPGCGHRMGLYVHRGAVSGVDRSSGLLRPDREGRADRRAYSPRRRAADLPRGPGEPLYGDGSARRTAGPAAPSFREWGERYLDVDPESRTRSPAAV